MNLALDLLWKLWGRPRLVRSIQRRAVLVYLRAVRATRLTVLTVLALALVLQLMMLSAFGALVTGFLLWNHDFEAKMEILFWIFAGAFTVPALLLMVLMSEFLWFRITGAKKMIDSL